MSVWPVLASGMQITVSAWPCQMSVMWHSCCSGSQRPGTQTTVLAVVAASRVLQCTVMEQSHAAGSAASFWLSHLQGLVSTFFPGCVVNSLFGSLAYAPSAWLGGGSH